METRNIAPLAAPNAMWDPMAIWANLMDLPRQQCAAATHAACAVFSGFEAMRRIQEKAAHEALKHYTDAAGRLEKGCAPADVLTPERLHDVFGVKARIAPGLSIELP